MKYLLFLILLPTICFSQKIKTKNMYRFYYENEKPDKLDLEQIEYFDTLNRVIKTEYYGLKMPKYNHKDTIYNKYGDGKDNFYIIEYDSINYDKLNCEEQYVYSTTNKNFLVLKKDFYLENENIKSNTVQIFHYVLPINKVETLTINKNGITIDSSKYIVDANGIKIYPRYAYKLDKQNRLIEKYNKANSKKSKRIERYTYNQFGNKKEMIISDATKIKSITTYNYNALQQIILESTKNIIGKKYTTDTIEYIYKNNVCIKEITKVTDEKISIVEYSYTYY